MTVWKNKLVPMLFVLASVSFLIPAVVKPVVEGEPLNHTFLVFAFACAHHVAPVRRPQAERKVKLTEPE